MIQTDPRCVFLCDENVGNPMETHGNSQVLGALVRQQARSSTHHSVFDGCFSVPKIRSPKMFSPQKHVVFCVFLCFLRYVESFIRIPSHPWNSVEILWNSAHQVSMRDETPQSKLCLCIQILSVVTFFLLWLQCFSNHQPCYFPGTDTWHSPWSKHPACSIVFFPCAKGGAYHSFKIFLNPMLFIYSRKVQIGTKFNTWFACLCKHIQVLILTTLYLLGFYCNQRFYVPIIFNCSFGRLAIHLPRPHHQGGMNAERYDQLGWPWHVENWWIWHNKCDLCQCNHPFFYKWQWVVS